MPLLRPRAGENDGGYAVADYGAVDPRLGTMADLEALADGLHDRDMTLCVDLVLNHTAREHDWARRAAAGDPAYRDMYLVFPDRAQPDQYQRTLPEVFPDTAPGSFTEVPGTGWVWTTFHEFQWDLNYANPAVFRAMLGTMLALANRGVDVIRLDAAPFLWKQLGFRRVHPRSASFLSLTNVSDVTQPVDAGIIARAGLRAPEHAHSTIGELVVSGGRIELPAWGFVWLADR